jgi:hypothetical protein
VTGFTILPVLGGSGRSGQWSREGQVSRAGGMVSVVLHHPARPRLDALLDAAFAVVERHIGVVTVTGLRGAAGRKLLTPGPPRVTATR